MDEYDFDYDFDYDEEILLQSTGIFREGSIEGEFDDEELNEIILTNKNIIYVISAGRNDNDVMSVVTPLSEIKKVGGNVQVKHIKNDQYGDCLQIHFKDCTEYWRFRKKAKVQIPQWKDALIAARMGINDIVANTNGNCQSGDPSGCVKYCENCGASLGSNAKFCSACGYAVGTSKDVFINDYGVQNRGYQANQRSNSASHFVYDGKIHKCRNCGEILKSFEIVCPSCGYELRDAHVSESFRAFASKMEELQKNMRRSDKETIISHIRTFPIPNTKEDLLEFLILAGSNIRENRYDGELPKYKQDISDAWMSKFEQAYRKAKISFKNCPEFKDIENLYLSKISEQRRAKAGGTLKNVISTIGPLFLMVFILATMLLVDGIKIKTENERLEKIVSEVYSYIEQEQYVLARSKASTLVFSGSITQSGNQAASKWDITRQQLLGIIDKAEYGVDYVSSPLEIRIGVSQDDLEGKDYSDVKVQLANRGFTNIKTEAVKDLFTGWLTSEGSVDKVSVAGDTVFSKDSVYSADVEIVIYYHTKQ